jgi:hypothetical protein
MKQRRQGRHGAREHIFFDYAGVVFGATLGNVLQHCSNPAHGRHATKLAMASLRRVLAPAGRALASCSGPDVLYLARGMACHRVVHGMARKLLELKRCKALDARWGSVGVVIGATAAILAAFECMSVSPEDCDGLDAQLACCLRDAQVGLVGWRMASTSSKHGICAARDAEVRALERARIGVSRAQEVGNGLSPSKRMRLMVDCFRRAAFPAGEDLGPEGHVDILKRIRSGELVDVERDGCVSNGATAPGIATLAALSALPSNDGAARKGSCDTHSSSGSSTWLSSWGSSGSQSSGGSNGLREASQTRTGFADFGLSCQDMGRLAAAFQTHGLSSAARALLSPMSADQDLLQL